MAESGVPTPTSRLQPSHQPSQHPACSHAPGSDLEQPNQVGERADGTESRESQEQASQSPVPGDELSSLSRDSCNTRQSSSAREAHSRLSTQGFPWGLLMEPSHSEIPDAQRKAGVQIKPKEPLPLLGDGETASQVQVPGPHLHLRLRAPQASQDCQATGTQAGGADHTSFSPARVLQKGEKSFL